MSDTVKIDLPTDVVDGAKRAVFQVLRVASPVLAGDFDRVVTRTVVTFGVRFLGTDLKAHDEPPVADLPVILPRGGGYGVHFDLAPGDPGVIVACDWPAAGFWQNGQVTTPSLCGHDWGCGFVIAGGRPSPSVAPVPPPNAPGTAWVGAEDGTATVVFSRAAGPTPAELGTVGVRAANPVAGLLLGTDDPALATLGAARLTDPVTAAPDFAAAFSAIVAAVNVIAPGTVTPPQLAAALANLGTISGASPKVMLEP